MRPDFSVRHSPRLTNMKGVETRMAPAEHGERERGKVRFVAHVPAFGVEGQARSGRRGLADQEHDEHDALQHQDRRVGHLHAALDQAAGRVDAAEQDGDRNDRQRVLAGEEGDEDAGEAVAGGQRGVGLALHRRDLEVAGEARRMPRRGQQTRSRSACRPAGPGRAARTLPPVIRAAKPNLVRSSAPRQHRGPRCRRRGPSGRRCRGWCRCMLAVADRRCRGLVGARRIAQRALDEEVHDRDGDIEQQQARDRLVDAAIVTQPPAKPIQAPPTIMPRVP
jgi:hypothetical protein